MSSRGGPLAVKAAPQVASGAATASELVGPVQTDRSTSYLAGWRPRSQAGVRKRLLDLWQSRVLEA